jgi:hypothetical protein
MVRVKGTPPPIVKIVDLPAVLIYLFIIRIVHMKTCKRKECFLTVQMPFINVCLLLLSLLSAG